MHINLYKNILIVLLLVNLKIYSIDNYLLNQDDYNISSIKDIIKLETLDPKEFKYLTNLEYIITSDLCLDLSELNLTDLTDISKLKINSNIEDIQKVFSISNNSFTINGLDYKLNLSLKKNELNNLPLELASLKNLTYIDLSNNKLNDIENINNVLSKIKTLEELYLYNNNIKKINFKDWKNNSLVILDLSNNKIENIPENINKLAHITILNLNSNKIRSIDNIKKLKYLKELYISHNNIDKIDFKNWSNDFIESIDLSDNKIKIIPDNIKKFKLLRRLNLSNNNIYELPKSFNLPNLTQLGLNSNFIQDITPIENLKQLKIIDASNNKISSIQLKNPQKMEYYEVEYLLKNMAYLIDKSIKDPNNKYKKEFEELYNLINALPKKIYDLDRNNVHYDLLQVIYDTIISVFNITYQDIQTNDIKDKKNKHLLSLLNYIKCFLNKLHSEDIHIAYYWPDSIHIIYLRNNSLTEQIDYTNTRNETNIILWDNEIKDLHILKGTTLYDKITPEILYIIYTFIESIL